MIDTNFLKSYSSKLGIDGYTILREYLQIRFLDTFYLDKTVTKIYFKGGTAIRLLLGSNRYSEDLDFSAKLPKNKIETAVFLTASRLKDEFTNLTVKNLETIEGYSAKLYLPVDFAAQPLTVKLDFSLRDNVLETQTSPITTRLPISSQNIVEHLSAKEILAEKIHAIMNRQKARDLYDLWFLLSKNVPFDKKLIALKLAYFDQKLDLDKILGKIKDWDDRDIDRDLQKFFMANDRRIISEIKRLLLNSLLRIHHRTSSVLI